MKRILLCICLLVAGQNLFSQAKVDRKPSLKLELETHKEKKQLSVISSAAIDFNFEHDAVQKQSTLRIKNAALPKDLLGEKPIAQHGLIKIKAQAIHSDIEIRFFLDEGARIMIAPRSNGHTLVVSVAKSVANAPSIEEILQEAEKVIPPKAGQQIPKPVSPKSKAPVKSIKKVVLDPGHGGKDSGAIGHYGIKEKDLTLQIARRIKTQIEKRYPQIQVYLTRNDDRYLTLPQRTRIANELNADLFISIHTNSHRDRNVHGVETYYLNMNNEDYESKLAARENVMDPSDLSDAKFFLADLNMRANLKESVAFGEMVQSNVVAGLKQKWRDTRDLGLKYALFYVLVGAKMPAILVETNFISNKQIAKQFKSSAYLDKIAESIAQSVHQYTQSQKLSLK